MTYRVEIYNKPFAAEVNKQGRVTLSSREFKATVEELEALALRAKGMEYQEIASSLGISLKTLENRFNKVLDRYMGYGEDNPSLDSLTSYAQCYGLLWPGTIYFLKHFGQSDGLITPTNGM